MNKKAYYFSIDAIIAATVLMTGLILASSIYVKEAETSSVEYYSQDITNILSTVKIYELNSSFVNELILSDQINPNKTIMEQAAQFWAEGNTSLATQLLDLLTDIVPGQYKVGVFFDRELIHGSNGTIITSLVSYKRLLSGITKGELVEGFSSKAQLTSFKSRKAFSYYYFGGFVGQGDLTIRLDLPTYDNLTSAYLELDASDNFTLHINDNFAGTYEITSSEQVLADKWQVNDSYLTHFNEGVNYINLTFHNSLGFVGGGFLKVGYLTSDQDETVVFFKENVSRRYYFAGIRGLMNFFDSFFIPGQLQTMFIHIHYIGEANTFLTIRNKTIWNLQAPGPGEHFIDLTNTELDAKLDYSLLSKQTVPLRFGSGEGEVETEGFEGNADVILVNDLSGSMEFCVQTGCSAVQQGNEEYCSSGHTYKPDLGMYCEQSAENFTDPDDGPVCQTRWHANCLANDTRKIDVLINATGEFVNIMLEVNGNRLGMVGYSSDRPKDFTIPENGMWADRFTLFEDSIVSFNNITGNITELLNYVNTRMDTYFESCICCGVDKGIDILGNLSNASKFKSMVVMSDGEATDKCGGGFGIGAAKADAINKAQEACNEHNISLSTVAFGQDADIETLQDMVCNGGKFYNATDIDELIEIYKNIANDINQVSYNEQIINVSSNATEGVLFVDSYIEYNYTPSIISEFGVIPAILESPRFGNNISETTLTVSPAIKLGEVRVTSYSGDSWTDNLTITNSAVRTAFSLADITNNYVAVGDPFVVYADPVLFEEGSNLVHISTGNNPGNYTGGSDDNVIIYQVLIPNTVPEQGVFEKADGCIWQLSFEDGTNTSLAIPPSYSGTETCTFDPASYPSNDAVDDSIFRLLSLLDFDNDGLLDVIFEDDGLNVNEYVQSNVPSLWGPTIVEVRVWQ